MKSIIKYIRIILGLIFLISGFGKIISSITAERVFITIFDLNTIPNQLSYFIIITIAILEILIALGLLFTNKKFWSYLSIFILIIFTLTLISLPLRGIVIPHCGCFGSIIPEGNLISTILKNIVFITINLYYILQLKTEIKTK